MRTTFWIAGILFVSWLCWGCASSPTAPDTASPVSANGSSSAAAACQQDQTAQVTLANGSSQELTVFVDGLPVALLSTGASILQTEKAHVVHTVFFHDDSGRCVCGAGVAANQVFAACEVVTVSCK